MNWRGIFFGLMLAPFAVAIAMEDSQQAASPQAVVNQDFSVSISEFLFFQLGTAGTTIDLIDFPVSAANAGDGDPIQGQGGNAEGGTGATAIVRSNAGQVTIAESNNSSGNGLANGSGQFIDYAVIASGTQDVTLPVPALSNAGGNSALPILNQGAITDRSTNWGFGYLNQQVVASGIYGTSARGGRVTFTATTP